MGGVIKIIIPDLNISVQADLLFDKAQKTVEALIAKLPIEEMGMHAQWCGNEIWLPIKNLELDVPGNKNVLPAPGEIFLVNNEGSWDVAIFYGNGQLFSPSGVLLVSHFATIRSESLEKFAEAANKLLTEGSKKIRIEIEK